MFSYFFALEVVVPKNNVIFPLKRLKILNSMCARVRDYWIQYIQPIQKYPAGIRPCYSKNKTTKAVHLSLRKSNRDEPFPHHNR